MRLDTNRNDTVLSCFICISASNVISGNGANGVLLTNGARFNTLRGNFIGTNLAGTAALGNALDGVAILGANNNSLIGTTFPQPPFVYLNLVSGNGGNGLRIHDS